MMLLAIEVKGMVLSGQWEKACTHSDPSPHLRDMR